MLDFSPHLFKIKSFERRTFFIMTLYTKFFEVINEWPLERPKDWVGFVNDAEKESELEDMRSAAQRGRPFGAEDWMIKTAKQLGLISSLSPRGRPKLA